MTRYSITHGAVDFTSPIREAIEEQLVHEFTHKQYSVGFRLSREVADKIQPWLVKATQRNAARVAEVERLIDDVLKCGFVRSNDANTTREQS